VEEHIYDALNSQYTSVMIDASHDDFDNNIKRIVGLSIGIIKNGKLMKAKGYGFANLEHNVPATENTVYKLASVSKQMVATGIMTLVQEGKLKLTDKVIKFYKDAPAAWNKITIRHLLNHTSGLQRESPAYQEMKVQPDSFLIREAYKDTLVFATGTNWQYCNLGYFILADIIRQVSRQSFSKYMKAIFYEHGLLNTQTTSLDVIVPNRADGYVRLGGDTILNAENNIALRPSGAFFSTITDMMKWEMLIQTNQILSKENWQQMWKDVVNGKEVNFTNADSPPSYGYGWTVSSYRNRKLVFHTGSLQGFRTIYCRFPDDNTAIVILTNSGPTKTIPLAQGVADILFKK
jgi:CubicO group peptidase (beta-lactamase class C family)